MHYRYEETCDVELGDRVLITTEPFEPDEAVVIYIGNHDTLRVRYRSEHIKPQTEWVSIHQCEFLSRESADVH
ncbi:hypothetical protein [Algiphilus sp.]|uniref:hypothetical protein n=1 Tax=Algiphilus sp. TaxID=1872431 RepID=UPI003C62D74B